MKINERVQICDITKTDLHLHTIYCDGRNTPEEMVKAAIEKGFACIGFSGHSYVDFDPLCGMSAENAAAYLARIRRLQSEYRGRITIFCGVEQDSCSVTPTDNYDYVIGSVHYIGVPDQNDISGIFHIAVDDTPELFMSGVEQYLDGDYYLAAEKYFEAVGKVVETTGADIIGHFDLISKFNEAQGLFDESHPRYQRAWMQAADRLLAAGKAFEINTGAVNRGWRSTAYPAPEMIRYLKERGGSFLLSSDSHQKETIGCGFENIAADLC